ncbi:hypothetical protein AC579_1086 [Pseudocercospora musae]|uniref:Uncharacterized protein n=1 Tax=Pseudocercospora musae TaxID=113226 RepID=A0A139H862_9PEZI|nr:hypothetical protein AC579_1086 [Pseudocercospora musae]
MPCNYKAPLSQAAFEELCLALSGSGAYINDITGAELNDLYDALVWSPPLPHMPAEEERNKRNLLAWILRNHPELSNPSQKMPTKAILHSSMQERISDDNTLASGPPIHEGIGHLAQDANHAQHIGPRQNADILGSNREKIQRASAQLTRVTADHSQTRQPLCPPVRKSTRRQPQASLQSVSAPGAVRPALSADAMDTLMQDVACKTLPASPTPPKRSSRKSMPLFVQEDEGSSEDELASSWLSESAQNGVVCQHRPQDLPSPSDTEDDAHFSDYCNREFAAATSANGPGIARDNTINNYINIGKEAGEGAATTPFSSSKRQAVKKHNTTILSTKEHPSNKNTDNKNTDNKNTDNKNTDVTKQTIRPSFIKQRPTNNIQIPTSSIKKVATESTTAGAAAAHQGDDDASSPKAEILQALSEALDHNTAKLREVCLAKNLDGAVNTLATMMSLVVMVRDSGFEVAKE